MDALSDVLRVAHLTGGVFLHADFSAPWCMAARVAPEHCAPALGPSSHMILYHYVVEGELRRAPHIDALRINMKTRSVFANKTNGIPAIANILRKTAILAEAILN